MHVVVIGGGASGIIAALTAAENKNNTVTLIERQARIGRKLLSTGNGRCNITNTNNAEDHYHGAKASFAEYALSQFGAYESMRYFSDLGLITCEQYGGRVYPASDSANSVVDVLRFGLEASGVELVAGNPVKAVGKKQGKFQIITEQKIFTADALIIACGGKAGGKLGGVSDGYELLRSFGHRCSKLYPALVPIMTDNEHTKSLKGVRCEAIVTLNGHSVSGEVQFTDNGISGPAAFDISREAAINGGVIEIDLLREEADYLKLLKNRCEKMPELECGSLLTGILHNRLGIVMVKYSGYKPSTKIGELTENDLKNIIYKCKHFKLKIKGTGSFDNAQITVGGILTDDFNNRTMESRLEPNLYACGEVLDIDADCGGYNLRWAWASGRLAGQTL